jgi:hypothetical protein
MKWMAEHHYTGHGRETVQSWLNNHVLPTFRDKRMCDIRLSTVKEWWAGMRAKRHHGKPYSASMLESVYVTTGSILRSAVLDKVIPVHPMDGWNPELPERDKAVRVIWEHARVSAVVAGLPARYAGPATLSATSGHRQGESFAVALEDVKPVPQRDHRSPPSDHPGRQGGARPAEERHHPHGAHARRRPTHH